MSLISCCHYFMVSQMWSSDNFINIFIADLWKASVEAVRLNSWTVVEMRIARNGHSCHFSRRLILLQQKLNAVPTVLNKRSKIDANR